MGTDKISDEILARSVLYQALSMLLRFPCAELKRFIRDQAYPIWKGAIGVLNHDEGEALRRSFDLLMAELERISDKEWIHQYENCFGHTAQSKLAIYELEYGEEHSFREPRQLADISAFYQAFGLRMNRAVHERADHIAVECEFVHFLLYKEAYALENDTEEETAICRLASHRFLSDHLVRWVPAFSLRLSQYAREGLLRQIGEFAFNFVVQDCKGLGIEIGSADLPIRAIQQESVCGGCPLA